MSRNMVLQSLYLCLLVWVVLLNLFTQSLCCSPSLTSQTTLTKGLLSGCARDTTVLNISGWSLQTVEQDAFEGFYALETIYMDHNEITALPVGLFDQSFKSSIKYIYARHNKITTLDNDLFKNNFNLVNIELSFNNIHFIDTNVFHEELKSIMIVNISYNQMTYFEPWPYIPNTYDRPERIRLEFDMRNNSISTFTNTMNWTYNLKDPYNFRVYLQYNKVSNFSNEMVFQYRDSIDGQSILTEYLSFEVNVSHNPFFCDCNVYDLVRDLHESFFRYVRVDEHRLRCASPSHLAGQDFLHDLSLDEFICNRTDNCPTNCTCQELPYISTLAINCTNTNLKQLPKSIPSLSSNIKYVSLYLKGNMITKIVQTNYTSLIKNLTVSNNYINYIDGEALKEMENIEKLDISGNSLKFVPKEIQKLSFDDVKIGRNPFECDCNMTWMADWVKLSSNSDGSSISCNFEGKSKLIKEVTEENLNCTIEDFIIIFSVVSGVIVASIIAGIITAKRCPYETKVLIYKLFRIHPRDRYVVDGEETMEYDGYLSFDGEDIQVRQWIKAVFMKKLEENGKKRYRFYCPLRDAAAGENYGDTLVSEMTKSKRVFILLSPGYFKDEWRMFEADRAEMEHNGSDDSHPRVVYIIWYDQNIDIKEKIKEEPWKSRLAKKRVLSPDEKFFWSKIRYELPVKPRNKPNRVDNSYTDIKEAARTNKRYNENIKIISNPKDLKATAPQLKQSVHITDLNLEALEDV